MSQQNIDSVVSNLQSAGAEVAVDSRHVVITTIPESIGVLFRISGCFLLLAIGMTALVWAISWLLGFPRWIAILVGAGLAIYLFAWLVTNELRTYRGLQDLRIDFGGRVLAKGRRVIECGSVRNIRVVWSHSGPRLDLYLRGAKWPVSHLITMRSPRCGVQEQLKSIRAFADWLGELLQCPVTKEL